MKWVTALVLGAIVGFLLPMVFGETDGTWQGSWAGTWTVSPLAGSPGLLFSIPVAILSAIAFRIFFNWHRN